jgi:hypothetical protein
MRHVSFKSILTACILCTAPLYISAQEIVSTNGSRDIFVKQFFQTAKQNPISRGHHVETLPPWIDHRKVDFNKDGYVIVDQKINSQKTTDYLSIGNDLLIDESLFINYQ